MTARLLFLVAATQLLAACSAPVIVDDAPSGAAVQGSGASEPAAAPTGATAPAVATPAHAFAAASSITAPEIQEIVNHLASDEMNGRHWRMPEGHKAAQWIGDRFTAAGLKPILPDGSLFQAIEPADAAPNVIAALPGMGDGFVIVSAHYDHLAPARSGEDRIHNGADDNASGVAGMIEIAAALCAMPAPPPLTVLFVAFTGEEAGLRGSRFLSVNSPIDLKKVRGMFNMDMISRGEKNTICIDGVKLAPQMGRALERANASIDLNLVIDTHPDWLPRSDQGPFLRLGVPAVLFSVEDHEDYHRVTDHADRIIASLAQNVARLVCIAVVEIAAEPVPVPKAEEAPAAPR